MSSSTKVFIYNNQYVADECADDAATFLRESRAIFEQQPDIMTFNSPFNTDGLNCPTFVVPGGSMLAMYKGVKEVFSAVRNSTVQHNFNYIGSCAGAFLGTQHFDVFCKGPNYKYLMSSNEKEGYCGLGLIDDFSSIGAFCPVEAVKPCRSKGEVAYSVELTMPGFKNPTRQLLVNGPGFFALPKQAKQSEVVAIYADKTTHEFDLKDHSKVAEEMAAVVTRKSSATRGGVFLSGPHYYACVKNSKLLAAFERDTKHTDALTPDEYDGLKDFAECENTRVTVEVLLRRTLK